MLFCQKCGGILMPKKEGSKTVMVCPKCGYKSKEKTETSIKEKLPEAGVKMAIIEEEKESHPLTERECPKCKHGEAYTWELQTRAADEPPTKFFKCTKCKHTWRDYS
jgi:DNA-directed RNA polymerase subunit M